MRVIAGTLKGRQLKAPSWPGLRPTSDKLRETIFDILAARVRGARVLDGYAGTGALGIEALSRGAAAVVFVERDRRAQALIAENLERCGIAEGYAIIRASFVRALETLRDRRSAGMFEEFDMILLDPPYLRGDGRRAGRAADSGRSGRPAGLMRSGRPAGLMDDALDVMIAAAGDLLARDGILVLEHARTRVVPERAGRLVRTRGVHAGGSALAFYQWQP
jgi:16S rRNA (guanine(966)-N(2))-methyltransferase RsmD